MKKIFFLLIITISLAGCTNKPEEKTIVAEQKTEKAQPEKITFPSLDSIPITANLYYKDSSAPFIVLCHQARYNKFEYTRIAKTLLEKGFNCLAIDQRSGGPLIEEENETMLKAKALGRPVDFLDAEQDIIAAINYTSNKYNKKIVKENGLAPTSLFIPNNIVQDEEKNKMDEDEERRGEEMDISPIFAEVK